MNRKTTLALLLCIIGMSIGFAAVSTVLYLTGNTNIASNTGDFDVYYSKAVENGVENATIIKDKTHIEFTTELTGLNDKYVLDYDVTNGSKQYDANLVMNCTGGNEYLRVENKFDMTKALAARTTRSGRLTLTVIKVPLTEMSVSISCEISGNAVERDVVGGDTIEIEKEDYLAVVRESGTSEYLFTSEKIEPYFGYEMYRDKVESINIMDTKDAPVGSTLIGDVSEKQNGSILMYSKDEDSDNMLELYIGQDGGVKANPNSNNLFASFGRLTSINGLENLNINYVTNMSFMFAGCGQLTTLDISHFDTSKVTNMKGMFRYCYDLTALDVSHFDTSQVTDMSWMFGYCRDLTALDLSHFDTSKVTNMSHMFDNSYHLTNLDISSFDTSQVTDMNHMFATLDLTSLDLSGFDTSKVTNMSHMFYQCLDLINLDISSFDTSKVTDMASMFYQCVNLTTTITIRGTNCTSYSGMFSYYCADSVSAQITVNYTADASDLVDQMIATKSSNSNVIKGTVVS